jgi:hypothetical protein
MASHLTADQSADKYQNRRAMAWWSFRLIFLVGIPLLAFGLYSDGNAARVESLSFLLATLFGVWVSVVLAYFGATTLADRKELEVNR